MASSLFFLNSDAKILELIRQGNDEGLMMLYRANRRPILSFVVRNNGSPDDAEDLLQEALIILWERVQANRFHQSARLGTFLYATVRNLWMRRLARQRREAPADIQESTGPVEEATALDIMVEDEQSRVIHAALDTLGEPCKTLLMLFYWEEQSMEQIAAALHFANAETAKSKKYQCKKALQKLLQDTM